MNERIIPERFLDAGDEPNQALTPIEGYEKYRLVSLKEAIEPIQSLFYNIDSMVEIARRNSRKPADGLTCDESGAIHLYSMQWPPPHASLYTLLNEKLRSKNRNTLIPWFLFLKLFLTALYKLPSLKGIIYRGVRGNLSDEYDEDHYWYGVSSCTETMNVMQTFIGYEGDRTIFNIECMNGKSIRSHSYFQEENEILLMPGSYFQVVSKWTPAHGLHIIHLREKTPPYITIISPLDLPLPSLENLTISSVNDNISSDNTVSMKLQILEQNKSKYRKWKQEGITIAGGNGRGNQLNQISFPRKIIIDDDNKTISIADYENNRIVQWKCHSTNGTIIAENDRNRNSTNQFYHPIDLIFDKENNSFIICDPWHRRVIRCFYQNATKLQILISNIDCRSLAMDKSGFIYVSDCKKNEVRKWKEGNTQGRIVAGGHGRGNHLNQFDYPTFIFVDDDCSIFVSDMKNHRVMKWVKGATEGIVVAGGNEKGNSLKQLSHPHGVTVDDLGQIFVVDSGNHRVMCWCGGDEKGSIVVGGNGSGEESDSLNQPTTLSFDIEGNLYIVDTYNHRIQKYAIDFD